MSVLIRCPKCRKSYGAGRRGGVCIYCGHRAVQKTYYIRVGGHSECAGHSLRGAREVEMRRKLELRGGRGYVRGMGFREFMEGYFIPHYRAKNRSFPKAVAYYFIERFGGMLLDRIVPVEVERAVVERTFNLADGTFNSYLKLIRRAFNYAVEIGLLERSPVKCRVRKEDNSRVRYLSEGEARGLLEECKKLRRGYVWEMVYIAMFTGLRYGEIRSLRRGDVCDGFLYVRGGVSKSRKGRVIPLTSGLRGFFEKASFDYEHDIKKLFRGVVGKLGIENFRFHDLRHTFASRLVMGGVDLYAVKELLGHHSVEMTQRYAHLSHSYLERAMDKVGA